MPYLQNLRIENSKTPVVSGPMLFVQGWLYLSGVKLVPDPCAFYFPLLNQWRGKGTLCTCAPLFTCLSQATSRTVPWSENRASSGSVDHSAMLLLATAEVDVRIPSVM
mmetsp:Transcript_128343/g.221686  ORF Transcript_128343/g.221686 Transcript_128343/m.221686 type:complete len:108 (-) Transcript_128343:192-515(-)